MDCIGGVSIDSWGSKEEDKSPTHKYGHRTISQERRRSHRRSSSQSLIRPDAQTRSGYFDFIGCKNEAIEPSVCDNYIAWDDSANKVEDKHPSVASKPHKACEVLRFSDDLRECETAICEIAKSCLDSDPAIENFLSEQPIIEGILEVLNASNDDEIMELAISVLAVLVARNERNANVILNSDPQLHIFVRLLRNNSLFLKIAALLYLIKPKAQHMVLPIEWIPLVLRVLEFGDQMQTLFTVQCSPQVAAYYLLNQILTGYDKDKFLENAQQIISLGGLRLLIRRMKIADHCERNKTASIIYLCIQADGSCRHFVARNMNKKSLLDLLARGNDRDSPVNAFALLTELLCLHRTTQRTEFLRGLVSQEGCFNLMHILLAFLPRALPEELLMIAAVLLQLDLLGNPFEYSIYREEAIEAMIKALDCQVLDEKVQEQSAKALLILGGQFSYKGDPVIEKWLLSKAGFKENMGNSFHGKNIDRYLQKNEEGDDIENWQREAAVVLYSKKRFLITLSDAIANGLPCLARASLVTISWMSSFLHCLSDRNLQSVACSVFVPQLLEGLKNDKALEERILASFSLLNLAKSTDKNYASWHLSKELGDELHALSAATWTAKELLSILNTTPQQINLPH